MGKRYPLSEIEKAQIKILSDKGFPFLVIARDIKRFRKMISNFLQDPEAYGTKKSTGRQIEAEPNRSPKNAMRSSKENNKLQILSNLVKFNRDTQENSIDFKFFKRFHT